MVERKLLDINEIEREFFIRGPVAAICKPKGFNRWCTLPYPGHKNGCPNFGKHDDCPPQAPYFLDLYRPQVYMAFMRFDFGEFLKRKGVVHPSWSERALRNPWHFQDHLDSKLRKFVTIQLEGADLKNYQMVTSPEAMGVNIHLTARAAGVELEWPPIKNMHRIVVLSQPLE